MSNTAYRDGKVHVCEKMCKTCVFRPGNLMHLEEGRVEEMVEESVRNESAIVCHCTLGGEEAVCKGFFDNHSTIPLRLAIIMKVIKYIEPPSLGDRL